MHDPTWPSVYFAYLLFFILAGGALFFFLKTLRHGYFGPRSEEPKYRMLDEDR